MCATIKKIESTVIEMIKETSTNIAIMIKMKVVYYSQNYNKKLIVIFNSLTISLLDLFPKMCFFSSFFLDQLYV